MDSHPYEGEATARVKEQEEAYLIAASFTRVVHEVDALDPHQALSRWLTDEGLDGYLPRWSVARGEAQVYGLQSGTAMERAVVMPQSADVLSEVMENA